MIENQKKNRHHFISQFYLKPFADIKNKKGKDQYYLQVLDKTNAKIYPSNVRKIAYEHQFNRLDDYQEHPNELEDWLGDLEGILSNSFKKLIDNKKLDHDIQNAAVNLMALFASRRPKGREHIQTNANQVENALFSSLYHNPALSEGREDGVTHEMIRQAIGGGQVKPTVYTRDQFIQTEFVLVRDSFRDLSKRTWHVIDNSDTNVRFITSDNPVVLFIPDEGFSPLNFSGKLLQENGIVYFPVSPTLALYGTLLDKSPEQISDRFAAELNTWMVNFADERLLFNSDGFKIVDNDGKLNTEKEVRRAISEWYSEYKKNSNR